jgi:hypothetical protein
MEAHAHTHLHAFRPAPGRERPLRGDRGCDRVARPREGDEERVTLGVDLATVVLLERRAQHALMLGQHLAIAGTQPRQQPRRTLDVAEQQRDGATRKLSHERSYAQSPRHVKSCPERDVRTVGLGSVVTRRIADRFVVRSRNGTPTLARPAEGHAEEQGDGE